jgi:hypothetical protein
MPRDHGGQTGQAAEPSADFDELEADEALLEPLDSREEPDDDPLDEEPLEDSFLDPPLDPLEEPESLELLGAGTEAEEVLRESVR